MKKKHLRIRIAQCLALAEASNCPRKKFGAMLLDPQRNVVLMDGYNGGPRGGSPLCGETGCLRDDAGIPSGSEVQIGCVHAEMNVLCNCASAGVKTEGSWLIVTGEPCLMCAKLLHHAGVSRVVILEGGYGREEGLDYLRSAGIGITTYSLNGVIEENDAA